jgi:hypothetical protein
MTELDVQSAIFEMPDRIWEALKYSIENQILVLEDALSPETADRAGVLTHISGGIHFLRHLLNELESCRTSEDNSKRIHKANYAPREHSNLSLPKVS